MIVIGLFVVFMTLTTAAYLSGSTEAVYLIGGIGIAVMMLSRYVSFIRRQRERR
jgi:hypothetical protein